MLVNFTDFPQNFKWINSLPPFSLESFRGHPILLYFWTFCNINCIQLLSELKKVEDEFSKKGLIIIGVHCAKFFHEQDFNNVREACHRLNVNFPVIIDEELQIWKKFAIRALPTFILIDSDGQLFSSTFGEHKFDVLKEQLSCITQNKNLAEYTLHSWAKFDDKFNLRFPTKTVAVEIHTQLFYFVSDTYNNRIVQLDSNGKFITSFGEGILFLPLGCCIWKDELIVCDSGHHRVIAFEITGNPQRKYRVLAGKGEKGVFEARAEFDAKLAPLNFPSDVCVWGNNLAITCGGSHQIALYISKDDSVSHIAGSGKEDLIDGPASFAALAQPSSITAISESVLAFTDSNSSAIRAIIKNWNDTGKTMVVSLVGGGLLDFGYTDGLGAEAKLQYPLSCVWSPISQNLYILDSYNNAMRIYSIDKDYLGTVPLSENLNEPSGLSWYDGNLIITDKNSHRIMIVNEYTVSQKDNIDSLDLTPVQSIFEGPFAKIVDYPKNNFNEHLV